ncbi:hypothetical protein HPB48_018128 [Haemaphysalis longicornis]|uniref:Peptidase M13 N-terminal domain-containing protein n=1 Tax=Haemaphysalis longicornis TaxID=44386 RepID=A0A9J6FU83_HAELO|nr:hypothetical protein HPB48_018128 [Haemaphysalis longicornis]
MASSARARALTSTCTTFACKEYSRRLRASLNTSANPCVSFTRFVCDGWRQSNLLDVWEDIFLQMLRQINWTLRSIEWPPEGQNDEQRAAAVYQSCNDVFLGRSDQLADVKRALIDAGIVWPRTSKNADALHTLLYCSLKLGWGTLLDFRVENSGNSTTLVISEGKSAFVLQRREIGILLTAAKEKAHFEFLKQTFKEKESDSLSYELMSSYGNTISRILALARYSYTIAEKAEGLNLTEQRWAGALVKLNVRLHTAPLMILTTNPEYLEEVVKVWNEYGEDSFHSLISWCTVQVAAIYSNRHLILSHYGWREQTAELYHTAFCISRAAFFAPYATFARYYRKVLSDYGEAKARETALSVRSTVFSQLSSWPYFDQNITVVGNWSSGETMFRRFDQAQEFVTIDNSQQVDMTRSFVKNWQRSVLFKRTPAVETFVQDINFQRGYSVNKDELDFQLTPYALYYPLFDTALPMSVNYGGLGDQVATALGDFIVDAFKLANVSQMDAFRGCLEAGPYGTVWDINNNPARTLTLRALIKAYLTSGNDGLGSLPGLERYSGLQTLFIARCYADCEGSGATYSEGICNIDLQYTPEFAEAFNCSPGDPMIAPRQCRLQGW